MPEISAIQFSRNFDSEIERCIRNHEALKVRREKGEGFVVIGESDWKSIEETLYLNQFPGLIASIREAAEESLSEGTPLEDIEW
ncbi:MAG TPA: prevent-host-death protein [Desulfobacteraceae bacterium]|nr:prevent-host-death protein [Desulfobacteraceae bacterium]